MGHAVVCMFQWRLACLLLVASVLASGPAGALLHPPHPVAPTDGAGAVPPSSPMPGADVGVTLDLLDLQNRLPDSTEGTPGFEGLAMLLADLRRQAQPEPETPNATEANGTHSHHHSNVGDEGLGAVWIAPFHGSPQRIAAADVDHDGIADALVGSEIALTAISGRTGDLLWARHIGSTVTSVFTLDADGDGGLDVAYSTNWGGQTPRLGVVKGLSGTLLWEHLGVTSSFLGAAPVSKTSGDILAASTNGTHVRLSGLDGKVLWRNRPDSLAATGTPVSSFMNLGHSLFRAADVNGDGISDSISASLHWNMIFLPVAGSFNQFSMLHALDGRTGERLWVSVYGGDPASSGYSFITDVQPMDADGDRDADVAFAGISMRYVSNTFAQRYESTLRIIDGSSAAVGRPIGSHDLPSVGGPIDNFLDLERTDVDADGREELVVLAFSMGLPVQSSSTTARYTLQRFSLVAAGPATAPVLLPRMQVPVERIIAPRIHTIDPADAGERQVVITSRTPKDGVVILLKPDWNEEARIVAPGEGARAVAAGGDRLFFATATALEVRSVATPMQPAGRFTLGGAPLTLASTDHDHDGYLDLVVRATDGLIHIIDGLTARPLADLDFSDTTEPNSAVLELRILDLGNDGDRDHLIVRTNRTFEAWDGTGMKPLWQTRLPGAFQGWFDGNGDGIPDVLSATGRGVEALSGLDGKSMWKRDLPEDMTLARTFIAAHLTSKTSEDVAFYGTQELLALRGTDGGILWKQSYPESFFFTSCLAAVDHDGDGLDEVYAVTGPEGIHVESFDAGGRVRDRAVQDPRAVLAGCDAKTVRREASTSEDLLLGLAFLVSGENEDIPFNGFGRMNAEGFVWDTFTTTTPQEFGAVVGLGADPDAADGGRVFYGREDHVHAIRWTDGTHKASFTINGPFVRAGLAIDLDKSSPAEVVLLSTDGLLWALAEDPAKVLTALDERARDLGKDPPLGAPDAVARLDVPAKKGFLPGFEVAALAIAIVSALTLRRRTR